MRAAVRNGRIVAGVDPTSSALPATRASHRPSADPDPVHWSPPAGAARARRAAPLHYWMPAYPSIAPGAGSSASPCTRVSLRTRATHGAAGREERAVRDARFAGQPGVARGPRDPDCQEHARGSGCRSGTFSTATCGCDGARTVRATAVAGLSDLARSDAWTLTRPAPGRHVPVAAGNRSTAPVGRSGPWQAATLPGSRISRHAPHRWRSGPCRGSRCSACSPASSSSNTRVCCRWLSRATTNWCGRSSSGDAWGIAGCAPARATGASRR